ncbi:MAG: hypothetical protein L0191_18825, partial [Acidobacteria bacterium]|nr:hypothetical protein [Acidobacteriota bacterium]
EEAHATLTRSLRSGSLSCRRVDESLARLFILKRKLTPAGRLPAFDRAEFDGVCNSLHQLDQASA